MQQLSNSELKRYNRHLILPEIGKEGQLKLKNTSVLVIGAGGLGCPVLEYLTAAGVGKIGVLDHDVVDESNLQRQVLYQVDDIGKLKAKVASHKLSKQNPHIDIIPIAEKITSANAYDIVKDFDILVDGSDNFQTRYLTNDISVLKDKVLVHGSIFKFEGQVSVFNYNNGPTYRCLFPEPPEAGSVPSCSQIGVMGILPGLVGTMMATEVIKVITGAGEPLSGKLLTIDTLSMSFHTLKFKKQNITVTELIDYDEFCGVSSNQLGSIQELSPDELDEYINEGEDIFILDVREPFELDICKLEAINIPLGELASKITEVPRDKKVIVYCHFGHRSKEAIELLQSEYGYTNLINLEGGIDNWAMEIDNSMERY